MPLQNRVTPTGDIMATPYRGMFTGNGGSNHGPASKTLTGRWASRAWVTGVCEFKGLRREVMGGRSWTEVFFLDEATALAAGHRPCFFCRRDDAKISRCLGSGQWRHKYSRARHRRCASPRAARWRQEAVACAAGAAGRIACRRDGAGGKRELSDRTGPGAKVVAGRLSRGAEHASRRDAADAALNPAGSVGGLSAGAA